MILDTSIVEAIQKCVRGAIPFACYMRPNESEAYFYADADASTELKDSEVDDFDGFLISMYGVGREKKFYGIRRNLSAIQILSSTFPDKSIVGSTTNEDDTTKSKYLADVADIIGSLSDHSEKIVYARQATLSGAIEPAALADLYFAKHPGCFRFLYFTPATGLWIGASPELLVRVDYNQQCISTMALAGTQKIENAAVWSEKNIQEHKIVVDYIRFALANLGLSPTVYAPQSRQFGNIEHLCTRIEASPAAPLYHTICELSPTPALCGWPIKKAASQIAAHEHFDRGCYGGCVGECTPQGSLIYVNLRSAEITPGSPNRYRLIAGGGITIDSVPAEEWTETEYKMKSLTDIIAPADI